MPLTAIIGTGTWGTAVAVALARADRSVLLWGRDPAKVATLAGSRRHALLENAQLPSAIEVTADAHRLSLADLILWAVPCQHSAAIASQLTHNIAPAATIISLAKGIEQGSLKRVSELLALHLPGRPLGVLSGPSHAEEVVGGKPACLVVAGPDPVTTLAAERIHGRDLRLYTSSDLLGVELSGAMKNVVAVAAGICDGLGLGDNLKAAVVTRGLAEMRRLGRAAGADDSTFAGLAGVGDLLTTCYSPHGRNRALGLAVGRGQDPQRFLADRNTVAEGAWTCRAALELGSRYGVELPITSEVASVLWSARPVATALGALLSRAPKEENA